MNIGELVLAVKEIYELIVIIKDIFKELEIDEKDIEDTLKSLKEYCEGPLVDAIGDVVNELAKNCSELIKDAIELFDSIEKNVREIEKTDGEGAKLLKEALYM